MHWVDYFEWKVWTKKAQLFIFTSTNSRGWCDAICLSLGYYRICSQTEVQFTLRRKKGNMTNWEWAAPERHISGQLTTVPLSFPVLCNSVVLRPAVLSCENLFSSVSLPFCPFLIVTQSGLIFIAPPSPTLLACPQSHPLNNWQTNLANVKGLTTEGGNQTRSGTTTLQQATQRCMSALSGLPRFVVQIFWKVSLTTKASLERA